MEKSSFVNKLSGQALQYSLITLYLLKVNIILHLQSSEVYLKIARLIKKKIIVVITNNVGKLICLFHFAIARVLIFSALLQAAWAEESKAGTSSPGCTGQRCGDHSLSRQTPQLAQS